MFESIAREITSFSNTYSSSNGTGGTDGGLVGVASKLQGSVSGVSHPNLNRQILYNATPTIFLIFMLN